MLQIISPKAPFDAIVVGSGATGGWAAKELTEAGMRVALLEAGACWVSSGCQNPTITMMAIKVRACEYIIREYSKKHA